MTIDIDCYCIEVVELIFIRSCNDVEGGCISATLSKPTTMDVFGSAAARKVPRLLLQMQVTEARLTSFAMILEQDTAGTRNTSTSVVLTMERWDLPAVVFNS